jgi:CCR4-NOT transcription complex subunit 6
MWIFRRFHAVKDHLIEFNQLAIEAADGSHDMINRVMTKDNIGLALLLETTEALWTNGNVKFHLFDSKTPR